MTLGPTGTFPLGGGINPIDRGGLYAGFTIIKSMRLGLMQFDAPVSWLAGTPSEMQFVATTIRQRIIRHFGDLPYDKSDLPIKVTANHRKGVIELQLPGRTETLAGNPEMWLALAEVLDTAAAEFSD